MSQEDIKKICKEAVRNQQDLLITVYKIGSVREQEPMSTEKLRFSPTGYNDGAEELKGYFVDEETLKSHTDEELAVNFIISAEVADRL